MIKQFTWALAGTMLLLGNATAGHGTATFTDKARVVDVEPIMRTVRISHPRKECWDEEVPRHADSRRGHNAGGMILGGVIGGIVGHQVGRRINKGRGRHAATAVGTLIGAAIGHDSGQHQRNHWDDGPDYRERCQRYTDYTTEERVDGYWVTYRYRGETFRTRMREEPGETVPVRVRVTPIGH